MGAASLYRVRYGPEAMALFRRRRTEFVPARTPVTVFKGGTELEVKGEASYQGALFAIAGPKTEEGVSLAVTAVLKRDPTNEYDPNAIAVYVDDDRATPRLVGFVNRDDASRMAPVIDRLNAEGKIVGMRGVIRGGWDRGGGDTGNFGIWLHYDPERFFS